MRPAACLFAAQYFSKVNYIIDSVKMHGVYPPPAPKLCKNSLPEASANSPSSTPRQRQIKLGAASSTPPASARSSPGSIRPLPASARLGQLADMRQPIRKQG